jgi:hypothetical protein
VQQCIGWRLKITHKNRVASPLPSDSRLRVVIDGRAVEPPTRLCIQQMPKGPIAH